MLALEFRFLTGRYHATPWGHHVNEGMVEWPPSPWRIMRALLATWHLKATHLVNEEQVRRALLPLCSELPRFGLPPARGAHTRHYMPLFKQKTRLVFDAFVRTQGEGTRAEPLVVAWPGVELPPDTADILDLLLARMGYLGRSESWVAVERLTEYPPIGSLDVVPCQDTKFSRDHEKVRVLIPQTPEVYGPWRDGWLDARKADRLEAKRAKDLARSKDPRRTKLTAKERAMVESLLPSTLWDALVAETSSLHKHGWSQPPGSRWVDYFRPRDAVKGRVPRRPCHQRRPTVARFAISSRVRPRLTEILPWAEAIRYRLLRLAVDEPPPVFTGHLPDGTPAQGHRHLHVIPEAYHRRGLLTHVTIYAPMGLDAHARMLLQRLRHVRVGRQTIDMTLLAFGVPADFGGLDPTAGCSLLFAQSKVWESRTPFVPTRHGKRHRDGRIRRGADGLQIDGPEADLRRLLRLRGLDEVEIEPILHGSVGGKQTRWLEFTTRRRVDHGDRAQVAPYGFRLVFPREITGPLLLGYGCHFGLGMFSPSRRSSPNVRAGSIPIDGVQLERPDSRDF